MRDALQVGWAAVKHTYERFPLLVLANIVTLLLLFPLVTGPPAVAALWALGRRAACGEPPRWEDYFRAFRACFGRAWTLAWAHMLVLALLAANLWFYMPEHNPFDLPEPISLLLRLFFLLLLLLWLLLSQYLLPLMLERDGLRLWAALRTAAVLLARWPGFSLLLFVGTMLAGLVSAAFPWLLLVLTPAFVAVLANQALLRLSQLER